jgi:hypothetical protein
MSHSVCAQNLDGGGNQFPVGGARGSPSLQCPDFADQLHCARHVTEGREALPVGVALASEVQFWLVAYAYEEGTGGSGTYCIASNRNGPVAMPKPSEVRRFVNDGGQKSAFVGQAALYDVDFDRIGVVIGPNSPIK